MIISKFDEDLLGLNEFSKRLNRFIDTEHDFVEGGLVIALTSRFGSGKTTFLKMWSTEMEAFTEENNKRLVIQLNAWESDYCGDPLFSIVSALATALNQVNQDPSKLLNAAKDLGWFFTAVGSQVANKFTGIDIVAAGGLAEKKKADRTTSIEISDAFSMYEKRKNAMDSLKQAIREIASSSQPKILFLVDELDRCRPDYAISYLETIKHLFDTKGAVFILAADREQLENSAKTAFGPGLDFEEYFRKFVHREVMLPPIPETGYQKLAQKYVDYYLVRKGSRICFMNFGDGRVGDIVELVVKLKLTPRQIQEVFRTLGHLFETTKENEGLLLWCFAVGSIFMSICKIGAPEIFRSLGFKRLEPETAITFLNSINTKYPEWWLSILYTGDGLRTHKNESFESVALRSGLNEPKDSNDLSQFYHGWGRNGADKFTLIYNNIQQISQWN